MRGVLGKIVSRMQNAAIASAWWTWAVTVWSAGSCGGGGKC